MRRGKAEEDWLLRRQAKWMAVGFVSLAVIVGGCGSSRPGSSSPLTGTAARTTGTSINGETYAQVCPDVLSDIAKTKADIARHDASVSVNDLAQVRAGLASLSPFLSGAQRKIMGKVEADYQAAVTALEDEASGHHAAARAQIAKVFAIRKTISVNEVNAIANLCSNAG